MSTVNNANVTNVDKAAQKAEKAAKAAAKKAEALAAKQAADAKAAAAAITPKAKKVNPIKEAKKSMLKNIGINRQSLSQCLAEVCNYGGDWLKLSGLNLAKVGKFRPSDLEPFQTESEAFRYVANTEGELVKERKGWTPARVAAAIERMVKAAAAAAPASAI